MSASLQQVNLLLGLEPPEVEAPLPLAKVKRGLIGFGVLLAILTALGLWGLIATYRQLSTVEAQRKQLASQVKGLKGMSDKQIDKALQDKVQLLAGNYDSKARLVALLSSEKTEDNNGYSPYFKAMAEVIPEGIWLTRFVIADEGVLLKGLTLRAATVATFAHDLGKVRPFNTIKFKRIDIDHDKKDKRILFEIATSTAMEEDH